MSSPPDSALESCNSSNTKPQRAEELQHEVTQLEAKLHAAKTKLAAATPPSLSPTSSSLFLTNDIPHHSLLLLSDSALPLGSFAFSSGLESYLAHLPPNSPSSQSITHFNHFLTVSLSSYASTTLPFVLAAFRNPEDLLELDDGLDAAIMCTVGRRASVAQGRALLGIWERSLRGEVVAAAKKTETNVGGSDGVKTIEVLAQLSKAIRSSSITSNSSTPSTATPPSNPTTNTSLLPPPASAHLPPLFGALSSLLGLTLPQTAYIYLLSHVKALLSAAVRASIFGPYMAQKILAGEAVQEGIKREIERCWHTKWEDAGQVVPVLDLWVGRHELLYSRIFNS